MEVSQDGPAFKRANETTNEDNGTHTAGKRDSERLNPASSIHKKMSERKPTVGEILRLVAQSDISITNLENTHKKERTNDVLNNELLKEGFMLPISTTFQL